MTMACSSRSKRFRIVMRFPAPCYDLIEQRVLFFCRKSLPLRRAQTKCKGDELFVAHVLYRFTGKESLALLQGQTV